MRSFLVFIIGFISAAYLINPTAGVFELIPDAFPIIGNLDEAGAALLLLNALDYFGVNATNLFRKEKTIPNDKTNGAQCTTAPRIEIQCYLTALFYVHPRPIPG